MLELAQDIDDSSDEEGNGAEDAAQGSGQHPRGGGGGRGQGRGGAAVVGAGRQSQGGRGGAPHRGLASAAATTRGKSLATGFSAVNRYGHIAGYDDEDEEEKGQLPGSSSSSDDEEENQQLESR